MKSGFEQEEYLYVCKAMIDICDAVVFLDNWETSNGAKKEMEYAKEKQKEIKFLTEVM